MRQVRFEFDAEKMIAALAYFGSKNLDGLTKLKVAKLFYFADKYHLLTYGRPVLGDVYYCLDRGPIPSVALDIMNDAISPDDAPTGPIATLFAEYIDVDTSQRYPTFRAKRGFNAEVFSESELEALQATVEEYGRQTVGELVDLTHLDPTWTMPNEGRPAGGRSDIPYELFFKGASVRALQAWEVLEAEQDDRDFLRDLNAHVA